MELADRFIEKQETGISKERLFEAAANLAKADLGAEVREQLERFLEQQVPAETGDPDDSDEGTEKEKKKEEKVGA